MMIVWLGAAFLCGALPFSVWLGRLALRKDIRRYGDGNPGATNVFRAGGKWIGVLAAILDGAKGMLPVLLARFVAGWQGWELAALALMPILGHAFSPFLGGRGGKAVAVSFGVWVGLTIWEAPTVLGLMLFYWFRYIRVSGWALLLAMCSLLVYLLLAHPDPTLLLVWAGNALVFIWKHRSDLRQPPGFKRRAPKPDAADERVLRQAASS